MSAYQHERALEALYIATVGLMLLVLVGSGFGWLTSRLSQPVAMGVVEAALVAGGVVLFLIGACRERGMCLTLSLTSLAMAVALYCVS